MKKFLFQLNINKRPTGLDSHPSTTAKCQINNGQCTIKGNTLPSDSNDQKYMLTIWSNFLPPQLRRLYTPLFGDAVLKKSKSGRMYFQYWLIYTGMYWMGTALLKVLLNLNRFVLIIGNS